MTTRHPHLWTAAFLLALVPSGCAGERHAMRDASIVPNANYWDVSQPYPKRVNDLVARMTLDEKISQLMHASPAIPRLGVPPCNWWNECLHGVARAGRATVFPQAIALAATFDETLIEDVGEAIGTEARAKYNLTRHSDPGAQYAGLTFWSPNVNIFRDPRWGRGQETYGEDPYLTGRIGAAFVRGLQGDKPPFLRVAACAKHFAAHSGPEAGRDSFNSTASPRDLQETYLPAFRALVDANVAGVMCAYNRVNDRPCCGDAPLIRKTLREDWGFEGYVVSDCGAINDIHAHHKVTQMPAQSASMALKGGVDLNCGNVYAHLREAFDQGLVEEEDIDQALSHLLTIRMRLGEFDPPNTHPFARADANLIACRAHLDLARRTAAKSIVLLKNANDVLPLNKHLNTIYVTGPNAADANVLLGNYRGISGELVTILEGVVNAVGPTCRVHYNQGCLLTTPNANGSNLVAYQAANADAVIAVLGASPLMEGETGDAIASVDGGDRSDLSLPANQLDLLRRLRSATGKPIVLVLTGGSPIVCPEMHELADAILFAWYPGEAGGSAVADILFGDIAPSGRLPITFPMSLDDLPPYEDYSMQGRTYRFGNATPLYPFGFGLTYSQVRYGNAATNRPTIALDEALPFTFNLSNKGEVAVEEVVQFYLTPLDVVADAPTATLCGFLRIPLSPNEQKTIHHTIAPEQRTTVDDEGTRAVRPGRYRLTIGSASPNPRSNALGAPQPVTIEFEITR